MDRTGTLENLRRAMADLVTALTSSDVVRIEAATVAAQRALAQAGTLDSTELDPALTLQLRSLTEAAQSLVWSNLLHLWARGVQSNNALLREAV